MPSSVTIARVNVSAIMRPSTLCFCLALIFTKVLPLALSCATTAALAQQSPTATLQIQTDKPIAKVSPTLYGLMTEEINYSYDGGLYGELVNSRAIGSRLGRARALGRGHAGRCAGLNRGRQNDGPSTALPRSLKLTVKQAGKSEEAGVQNDGYWGIPVRPDTTYQASFYAKADSPSIGAVKISIVKDSTGEALASATDPRHRHRTGSNTAPRSRPDMYRSPQPIISSSPSRTQARSGSIWSRSFRLHIKVGNTAFASI